MTLSPYFALSVATTGLFSADYEPKLLEVAAVLVSPGEDRAAAQSTGPGRFHHLIHHPPETFRSVQATQAQRFHGITPEMCADALPEEEVREAFLAWRAGIADVLFELGSGLGGWRAYNRDFVASVLKGDWTEALGGYGLAGRCVMEEASEVLGTHGVMPYGWDGSYKYPSLKATVSWLQRRDHDVSPPEGRAAPNAQCVAEVCLALSKERALIRARSAS